MRAICWFALIGLGGWVAVAPVARAQVRPYIGYTYPAGGQQGTTFQIKLGGQGLDDVNKVLVTGSGVTAKVVEYYRRLNPQEMQLLNEQVRELRRTTTAVASAMSPMMSSENSMMMMTAMGSEKDTAGTGKGGPQTLTAKIAKRQREYVQTPACASISSLVIAEVKIASDAAPGAREIRLATPRGVSNPLVFHVGQLLETCRKPMITASLQVLGKEASALRKRPTEEVEVRVTLPCTVNGQIASAEVNRYRFEARKGQRLVFSTQARELVPYIADAVPGWFQPVLVLYDAKGKEVAFGDDYLFKPDPVILFEAPENGEYVLAIYDSLHRGREDFGYRITMGELPFVTSLFPLGRQVGAAVKPKVRGWNVQEAELSLPAKEAPAGIYQVTARGKEFISNPVPFAVDKLPVGFEREPNTTLDTAQKLILPVIVNGQIEKPDDWDVFQFSGKSNQTIVAEVDARRLDSPLDSVLKLTNAKGKIFAFNDDREDLGAGLNTHHADSYLTAKLPADGAYYVHIGDTARKGGEEYAYHLRISPPQPDFALRIVPSSVSFRTNSSAAVTVYVMRTDGFTGPIKVALKDPPPGFTAAPITISGSQTTTRFTIRSGPAGTKEPVSLSIVGSAKVGEKEITREAVPAEDRMQAFLWRHLVPAKDLKALVFDPTSQPAAKRIAPTNTLVAKATVTVTNAPSTGASTNAAVKPKFTKQQIAGRLRQLRLLYEEGLLTDKFYLEKVAECEAVP